MSINKELLKGSTALLVLSLLGREPMYGYQMIGEIDRSSGGVFRFREGTLYPILHTLEAAGLLESYWGQGDGARQRKYYRITASGRRHLESRRAEWDQFRSAVDRVVWEGGQ